MVEQAENPNPSAPDAVEIPKTGTSLRREDIYVVYREVQPLDPETIRGIQYDIKVEARAARRALERF